MANQERIDLLIGAKNQAKSVLNSLKSQIIGIGTAYLSWKVATDFLGDSIKAAIESEKVYANLAASIERHGGSWKVIEGNVRSFTDSLQRNLNVSDEVAAQGLQKLIDYGMTTASAMRTLKVATDFATGANMDLMSAIELLGKASVGYTATLSRYGIIIDESIPKAQKFEAALAQLQKRFGGAAAAEVETTAGQIKKLTIAWEEFKKSVGELALASNIDRLLGTLTKRFEILTAVLRGQISVWEEWKKHPFTIFGAADVLGKALDTMRLGVDFTTQGLLKSGHAFDDTTNKVQTLTQDIQTQRMILSEYVVGWQEVDGVLKEVKVQYQDLSTASANLTAQQFLEQQEYSHFVVRSTEEMGEAFGEYETTTINASGQIKKHVIKDFKIMSDASEEFIINATKFEQGFATTLVNSTQYAVGSVTSQLQLLTTQSHGFFKQMGVNFVNEFVRRAINALLVSGLLKLFSSIFGGGIGAIIGGGGSAGGGFGSSDIYGAAAFPGGGGSNITESIVFAAANRRTTIVTNNENLTGRSLVQLR